MLLIQIIEIHIFSNKSKSCIFLIQIIKFVFLIQIIKICVFNIGFVSITTDQIMEIKIVNDKHVKYFFVL